MSDKTIRLLRFKRRFRLGLIYLGFILISLIFLYPTLWMVSSSFKNQRQMFKRDLNLIPYAGEVDQVKKTLETGVKNYKRAWKNARFSTYFFNTVIFAVGVVLITLLLTSTSGYIMAKYDFPWKKVFLVGILVTILVPRATNMIPLFHLMRVLHLADSRWGYTLATASGGLTMAILFFMGFFKGIPDEMEDSAKMDGCNLPRRFWYIMLPLSKPIIATVIIVNFIAAWKEFLMPLIFTFGRPDLRTLGVGMYAFVGEQTTDWTGMAAAATISLLPMMLVFILFQKYFIEGLAGAVKG